MDHPDNTYSNLTPEEQLECVKDNVWSLQRITNATEQAQEYVIQNEIESYINYLQSKNLNLNAKFVANRNKDIIIKYLLHLVVAILGVSDNHVGISNYFLSITVKNTIKSLIRVGIDWPELKIIEKSLNNIDLNESIEVNFKNLPELLKNINCEPEELQLNIIKFDHNSTAYILNPSLKLQICAVTSGHMIGYAVYILPKINNPDPELFLICKDLIIKGLLYLMNMCDPEFMKDINNALFYLRRHKILWPELDIIEKSIEADK